MVAQKLAVNASRNNACTITVTHHNTQSNTQRQAIIIKKYTSIRMEQQKKQHQMSKAVSVLQGF
jgi:hypothetical protein